MLYYVLRRTDDKEPLALIRVNATTQGNMVIGMPGPTRFGTMAPVTRLGRVVYNLIIGDNKDVEAALDSVTGYRLEEIPQAEWESFDAFDLFPVLKLAMAR
jgi:hypothetical protein